MAALGTEAVLSPAIGAWIGLEIDRRQNWAPWGMVVGLLLGGAVAIKLFLEMNRENNEDE
jgi:F0F1-type ATP synthase assembly protein I